MILPNYPCVVPFLQMLMGKGTCTRPACVVAAASGFGPFTYAPSLAACVKAYAGRDLTAFDELLLIL